MSAYWPESELVRESRARERERDLRRWIVESRQTLRESDPVRIPWIPDAAAYACPACGLPILRSRDDWACVAPDCVHGHGHQHLPNCKCPVCS